MKPQILAFYLPQFHPTPENDEWWGKGFTEWTNVAKAKPLYKGHYQPKIPADLGFYDLRLPQTREAQAELAKRAGITGFCYWHYWFGNGKQLLQYPFNEVLRLKQPDFPFCLAWANHDWINKLWTTGHEVLFGRSKTLMKQEYPGEQDYIDHFYSLLEAFRDERYLKIHGKLLFMVYNYKDIPDFQRLRLIWEDLAENEGLPGFFFVTHVLDPELTDNPEGLQKLMMQGYDAINLSLHHAPFNSSPSFVDKYIPFGKKAREILKSHLSLKPQVVNYKDALEKMDSPLFEMERIYPTIIPNWDHTPRSGRFGRVFQDCTPELFGQHVRDILARIRIKDVQDQVIFLKSWNEWGEGNYMEPDLKFGCQFIDTLAQVLSD